MSVLRAAYWFVYYTFGYVKLHLALARSTLVLNDRHFVDILVDRRRYRYGGPLGLMRLIWRLIPKPDLIILLDAPPEVLQARKQEVSFEETDRQRRAYLSLVGTMANGRVVDATQSLECVADDVSDIILQHLAARIARRVGLEQNIPYRAYGSTFAGAGCVIMPVTKEK
jgi:thymidylate kinase